MGRRDLRGASRALPLALLLGGAYGLGCAAPRPPVASAVPASASVASPATEDDRAAPEAVHYRLELVEPETPLVCIHVETRGDPDGATELTLDEGWAGIAESGADLELVEARAAGEPRDHERVSSFTWRVRHAPDAPLALVFELRPTTHRASSGPPEYYLPILESGLLHLLGAQALPAPAHLEPGAERPITLAWTGFGEAGWSVISSFGTGDVATTRSLAAFRHAVFLAGELRLLPRDVHGRPLWIAVNGSWSFGDEEFADLAARIVALGREFFADFEQPFYLISLLSVGASGARGSSYGGTGLTDSFALFVTPDTTLEKQPGGGGIAWLLAHELFHEWNGQALTLAQPEQLGYWFSEGFTDFYARALLFRGGLLDQREYLDSWNHKLAAQAANPERAATAERVREAFWSSREVGEVPYQRGDLIALHVDHAIRARSRGERSLDDLMRALVERARAGGEPLSNDALVAAIGEFAGTDVAADVRAWAVDGVEPPLAPDAAGAELELVPVALPTFDTGFDHESALRDGVVSGVRPGSSAERAGLRDGMRLAAWSVNFGQVHLPIEVSVRDGGTERKLSYLPHGATVTGYRLQHRP